MSKSEKLSPLKRAYLAIEAMEARLAAAERKTKEPIAIVGLGCRVPGGGDDPASFWRLLRNGVDAVTEVPPDRFKLPDVSFDNEWAGAARWGGFLEGVDRFDPLFFGIAPREAVSMDPQQRLLLEVTWEALEHAGYAPDGLSGSATGVFMALCSNDYSFLHVKDRDPETIDAHYGSGISHSIASGRLSYVLGLQGPCLTIDTACSSSLVAVHLACQSLRLGESSMALAGGVNLILTPENNVTFAKAGMLSRSGRCRTFDAGADGYVRSEGSGVVVLKRLSDALSDGDTVHAVVRGSAVNQDGPSAGLTAPNGRAQQAVIRRALEDARVGPDEITYVEAHGTGTFLGDPIELRALGSVLGETGIDRAQPVRIGSVKTNLGHLEAAAGVVGLIKIVLAMKHEEIPKHLHFEQPNPHIDWAALPLEVARERSPWPRVEKRRLAGLSSFGFSGTNAHVVVEEPPARPAREERAGRSAGLFVASAKTEKALSELLQRHQAFLTSPPDGLEEASLDATCYTASAGRAHAEYRAGFVVETLSELRDQLAKGAGLRARAGRQEPVRVGFLFTGQGAQYAGMGRELFETEPVFRGSFERSGEILREYLDFPLSSVVFPEEAQTKLIHETRYTQPALFALEYALYELWRSWGVAPSVVAGHSIGEYVAATVAGVWELEDGLRLIAERGRLMQSLSERGTMAAVFAEPRVVSRALEGREHAVSMAAVNGPANVVISGDTGSVAEALAALRDSGVESRELQVSHAFHSPMMLPILDEFDRVLAGVRFRHPSIRIVSGSEEEAMATPSYWREHVCGTVNFTRILESIEALGVDACLELGPSATLTELGTDVLESVRFLPSLWKGRDPARQMLETLGELYILGASVDWEGFHASGSKRRVALPTYPFQRQRYWIDSDAVPTTSLRWLHPLVERRITSPALQDRELFTARLRPAYPDFLGDHRIRGELVLPTTAYLEMVLAASDASWGARHRALEDVVIREPLVIDEAGTEVQVILQPDGGGRAAFEIVSESDGAWMLNASGRIVLDHSGGRTLSRPLPLDELRAACKESVDVGRYYEALGRLGFDYGARFHVLESLHRRDGEAVARIELRGNQEDDADRYRVHPTLLDACLQLVGPALYALDAVDQGETFLPFGIERFEVFRKPARRLWAHASVSRTDVEASGIVTSNLELLDDAGQVVAVLRNLQLARSRERAGASADALRNDWLYDVEWRAVAPPSPAPLRGTWLLAHHGASDLPESLAVRLEAVGVTPVVTALAPEGAVLADAPTALDTVVYFSGPPPSSEPTTRELDVLQQRLLGDLLRLVRELVVRGEDVSPRLVIVTEGAEAADDGIPFGLSGATLGGFARTLLLEHPELRSLVVDLEPGSYDDIESLVETLGRTDEDRLARRDGSWLAPRLVRRGASVSGRGAEGNPDRLEIQERGLLENLVYRPMRRLEPKPGEVEIEVVATALNFRDVLNALGMYPGDAGPLGTECAGFVRRVGADVEGLDEGDEVLAALTSSSFARYVTASASAVVRKPARLSFEQAITIPNVFLTAYYGLVALAGIKAGDRVLVHAGAGGVGLAAIALARRAGAEIYATAGSPRKRAYLASIGIGHVFDSRTLEFGEAVRDRTNGEGVDVILNSLSGEFIPKSLSVLKPGGRFVEIGRRGIWKESQVKAVVPGASYFVFDAGDVYHGAPDMMQEHLELLMAAFDRGELEPLPMRVFPVERTEEAFRYMAQARHVGKVVVSRRATGEMIRAGATYLVTGGHGALGRAVALWLVEQGASHLVLASRRGGAGAEPAFLAELEDKGARVEHVCMDVSREDDVRAALGRIQESMPPLCGLFHAAGTIDDAVVAQQEWTRFQNVLRPKLQGAWNLHRATRALPLEHFVLFSSSAAFLGSAGQSNYAAANAFVDALAHYRRSVGLPALSVNWGPWAGSGMASADSLQQRYRALGLALLPEAAALAALGRLLRDGVAQSAVQRVQWRRFVNQYPSGPPSILALVAATTTPESPNKARASSTAKAVVGLAVELEGATRAEQRETVSRFVQQRVESVLGIDGVSLLESTRPLSEVGLDSLMAVELRNILAVEAGRSLPATLLFKYPTVEALTDFLMDEVFGLSAPDEEASGERELRDEEDLEALSALSEDEARELLAREVEALSGDLREGDR